MKKILSVLLVSLIVLSFSSCGQDSNNNSSETIDTTITESQLEERDYTFRNTVWGDSPEQVKKSEEETLTGESDEYIVYQGSIMGYNCSIIYQFEQDKLYSAGYYINGIYSSAGQYISAYEALKKELYNKYGDSTEDEIFKLENDSLIETAGASRALEFGYVAYRASWLTETTNITLAMMAENYDITITLSYTDKNYQDTGKDSGI